MDNAPGPDPLANASLQISVLPNPGSFQLVDTEYNTGSNNFIRIMVSLKTLSYNFQKHTMIMVNLYRVKTLVL